MNKIMSWMVFVLSVLILAGSLPSSFALNAGLNLRGTAEAEEQSERPVMHTFFTTLDHREDRSAMLHLWEVSWYEAGWEPRILTLDDAKQHPDYDRVIKALEGTLLDPHNKICILRWLAMAGVGGWMSDYDTLPIRNFAKEAMPLPNYGILTVHDRHVPDLVSGSPHEWLRMANNIVEAVLEEDVWIRQKIESGQKTAGPVWSDILALAKWAQTAPDMYYTHHMVYQVFDSPHETLAEDTLWSQDFCRTKTPPYVKAVHVAPSSVDRAVLAKQLHPHHSTKKRADIAKAWLTKWRASCAHAVYYNSPESQ